MNISTWYYGLSTIAQTLAGILGLGAVFVILGFEGLSKQIAEYKERGLAILEIKKKHIEIVAQSTPIDDPTRIPEGIKDIIIALKDFWDNYEPANGKYRNNSGIYSDIQVIANKYGRSFTVGDLGFVKYTYINLKQFVEQRDKMINLVMWPGIFTTTTIMLALSLLGLTNQPMSFKLLGLVVILALLSIILTVKAIWKILKSY